MSDEVIGLTVLAGIALLCVSGLGVILWQAWLSIPPLGDDASSPLLQRQLVLGAIYTVLSPRTDRRLSGWTHKRYRREIRRMLDETWNVRGPRPKEAMQMLMNLGLGEGHRSIPDLVSIAEELAERDGAGDDAAKSLLAWDVARYADLARHGFSVGYLTRKQALHYLQWADDLSRDPFDSWAEFGAAFVFAKRVFNAQLTEQEREEVSNIDEIRDAVRRLCDEPESAWRRIAWR